MDNWLLGPATVLFTWPLSNPRVTAFITTPLVRQFTISGSIVTGFPLSACTRQLRRETPLMIGQVLQALLQLGRELPRAVLTVLLSPPVASMA
jgi:hypothetical protein